MYDGLFFSVPQIMKSFLKVHRPVPHTTCGSTTNVMLHHLGVCVLVALTQGSLAVKDVEVIVHAGC